MRKMVLYVVLLSGVISALCYAEESIRYIVSDSDADSTFVQRGTILFDESGIVKYYKREERPNAAGRTGCEFMVTKTENGYHSYENLYWGPFFNITEDINGKDVLFYSAKAGVLRARCEFDKNILRFVWNDGDIGFEYRAPLKTPVGFS